MADLPKSVRYVKNGAGGQWWPVAKANNEIHLGWSDIPDELLRLRDYSEIQEVMRIRNGGVLPTSNFNALRSFLDSPSQHVWITFEEGSMWWCTVRDEIQIESTGESRMRGHFWLTCDRLWSNQSLGGRPLAVTDLPGSVTTVAGFRATYCMPKAWRDILRIINDEEDADAVAASSAREAYEHAVDVLVRRLRDRDFEVLIDLILSRTGWVRLAKVGGTREGIDIEVENFAAGELAFVQVKSTADQATLERYVERFEKERTRYARMIFAVHTPRGTLAEPHRQPVQVWSGHRLAKLVVKLGLGEWVTNRV